MSLFDPDRTILVDHVNSNFLFRGNLPVIINSSHQKVFAKEELMNSLTNAAKKKCTTLPSQYKLIDISLIEGEGKEGGDFHIEEAFAKEHPCDVQLIHYDAKANLTAGILAGGDALEKTANNLIVDDIRNNLENSQNTVIYVHCEAGLDRTGFTIGSYAMRYLGISYKDALVLNTSEGLPRNLNFFSEIPLEKYAQYLKDTLKIPTIGPIK